MKIGTEQVQEGEVMPRCQGCGKQLTEAEGNYCTYRNYNCPAIKYGEEEPIWLCRACQPKFGCMVLKTE